MGQCLARLFCNRVHLHIVFVLNSTCHSVGVLSCVDVIQSFTYVLRVVILDVTKRRGERAREKARGNTNGLWHVPSKEKKRIKSGTTGCGSFVDA